MKRPLSLACVLTVLLAAATGCCCRAKPGTSNDAGGDPLAAGWHEQTMDVAGAERWYRYYVPSNAPSRPPVVVLLHGGKLSMRKMFESKVGGARGWRTLAEKEGFILVTPNGTQPKSGDTRGDDQMWNDLRSADAGRQSTSDDVRFISDLLDWAAATLHTDPRRAYVTGASNGGMMTYRLLVEIPERFAAAATFIATMPADLPRIKKPAQPVPLLISHGTKDPIIKWDGGNVPGGMRMASSADTLAWWIQANHANAEGEATEALPDTDPEDRCLIYRTLYPALDGGAPVLFYKVEGGSHAMPSREHTFRKGPIITRTMGLARDVEGAEIAWEFMKQFTIAGGK